MSRMSEREIACRDSMKDSANGEKYGWSGAVVESWTQPSRSMHRSAKSRTLENERNRPTVAAWMARRWARSASASAGIPSDETPSAACSKSASSPSISDSVANIRVRSTVRLSSSAWRSTRVAAAEPLEQHVLRVGMEHEGQVARNVHPPVVHGGDELHEIVEKAVHRGAHQRIAQGDVVGIPVQAGEAVALEREERFRGRQDDDRLFVRWIREARSAQRPGRESPGSGRAYDGGLAHAAPAPSVLRGRRGCLRPLRSCPCRRVSPSSRSVLEQKAHARAGAQRGEKHALRPR